MPLRTLLPRRATPGSVENSPDHGGTLFPRMLHCVRPCAFLCPRVRMQPSTLQMILAGEHPKGDVLATARIATIVFCVNNFRAELLPFRKIPMLDVTVAESRPLANLPVKRFLPRDACFPRTRPVLATSVCAKSTVQRLITFTFRWTRTR